MYPRIPGSINLLRMTCLLDRTGLAMPD